jgi:RNA polymerase sigma factor (sigma-70 family)
VEADSILAAQAAPTEQRMWTLSSDEQIIRRVLDGQTEDYRVLMDRYERSVYWLAYRVLGRREDAEDAAQETFLKAYGKLDDCKDLDRFWPWLRRIALNHCISRLRLKSSSEILDEIDEPSGLICDSVEAEVITRAELDEVWQAVENLSPA